MALPDTSHFNHSVPGLVAFVIVGTILSILALALRFWSRLVTPKVLLGLDDWLALCALPCTIAVAGLTFNGANTGAGKHLSDLSDAEITHLLMLIFVGNVLFDLSISFSKVSAMVFYGKVFRVQSYPSRAWRWTYYIILGLSIAWPIASIPYAILQCTPVHKFWDFNTDGTCSGQYNSFVSSAVSSVIIDLAILVLPIWPIWRLRLKAGKKLAIGVVFVLGYSVASMSIGRMITVAEIGQAFTDDITYEFIPMQYWAFAECALSTFVICLPAIFHLGRRLCQFGPSSLLNSKEYTRREPRSRTSRSGSRANNSGFRLQSGFRRLLGTNTKTAGGSQRSEHTETDNYRTPYNTMNSFNSDNKFPRADIVPLQGIHIADHFDGNSSQVCYECAL